MLNVYFSQTGSWGQGVNVWDFVMRLGLMDGLLAGARDCSEGASISTFGKYFNVGLCVPSRALRIAVFKHGSHICNIQSKIKHRVSHRSIFRAHYRSQRYLYMGSPDDTVLYIYKHVSM